MKETILSALVVVITISCFAKTLQSQDIATQGENDAESSKGNALEITEQITLPEVDLGRIEPGERGEFLLTVNPGLDQTSTCIQVAKSCVCTQVSFLDGIKTEQNKPLLLLLEINATSGRGAYASQFHLALQNERGVVQVTQPFKYYIEREIDFGAQDWINLNLFENDLSSTTTVKNNSNLKWVDVRASFTEANGVRSALDAVIENQPTSGQIASVKVSSLCKLMDELKTEELAGNLQLFVSQEENDGMGIFRKVASIPVRARRAAKMRLFPDIIFIDAQTDSITLRVLLAKQLDGLRNGNFAATVSCEKEILESQAHLKNSHWLELELSARELRSLAGKKLTLEISSGEVIQKFTIPVFN